MSNVKRYKDALFLREGRHIDKDEEGAWHDAVKAADFDALAARVGRDVADFDYPPGTAPCLCQFSTTDPGAPPLVECEYHRARTAERDRLAAELAEARGLLTSVVVNADEDGKLHRDVLLGIDEWLDRTEGASDNETPPRPCRIVEYDGAFKCLEHKRTWGAVPNPDKPCVSASKAALQESSNG